MHPIYPIFFGISAFQRIISHGARNTSWWYRLTRPLPCLKVLLFLVWKDLHDCFVLSLWLIHGSRSQITPLPSPWWAFRLPLPGIWAAIPFLSVLHSWRLVRPTPSLSLSNQRSWAEPWVPVVVGGWEQLKSHLVLYLHSPKAQACILLVHSLIHLRNITEHLLYSRDWAQRLHSCPHTASYGPIVETNNCMRNCIATVGTQRHQRSRVCRWQFLLRQNAPKEGLDQHCPLGT